MNDLKKIEKEQNAFIVDKLATIKRFSMPKLGWIKTLRTALSMNGASLARRLGLHRSIVSYLERAEQDGSITLKKLQQVAQAMECELIYALVPKSTMNNPRPLIRDVLQKQAHHKASKIVNRASTQMIMESQELKGDDLKKEVNRLSEHMLNEMPKDFWAME